MKFSLIDRLGVGNAGAIANVAAEVARRQQQDEVIERLVAALARHGRWRPVEEHGVTGRSSPSSRRVG